MRIIKFSSTSQKDANNANTRLQTPKLADNNEPLTQDAIMDDNKNEPNQLDLYSQLSNWHESDNITMIIGGNTYTASKQQMISVLSYYIGMVKMREMSLLPGFGETPNTPNTSNTPNATNTPNRNIKK